MISPMGLNDTKPIMQNTFIDDDGKIVDLSSVDVTTIKLNFYAKGVVTQGQGSWTITNGAAGQANYTWNAQDNSVPGVRLVFPTIGPQHFDAQQQFVLPY